jgi:hypothetical protein
LFLSNLQRANFLGDLFQVFELMQEMQSYGHPPKDLVGEMPASPFAQDLTKDQCVVS